MRTATRTLPARPGRRPRVVRAVLLTVVAALLAGPATPTPAAAIVNGDESELGAWPWQVALVEGDIQQCGGVLLTAELVVTAAHCTEGFDLDALTVVAGSVDLRRSAGQERDGQERAIERAEAHEDYDPATSQNDLALLTLDRPLDLSDTVAPVALPGPDQLALWAPGATATVTGFGAIGEEVTGTPVLREAVVEIVDDDACEAAYLEDDDDDVAGGVNLCAGLDDGSVDSCYGDSGGPLVVADAGGTQYLVGLVSWGAGCAVPGRPTVHTEIPAFLGWLADRGVGGISAATSAAGEVPAPVRIPATGTIGKAERYPLAVDITGLDGPVTDVDVELRGLTHSRVADLDVWLVAPDDTMVTLLAGVDAAPPTGATLTIDAAGAAIAPGADLDGGRWQPTGRPGGGVRLGPEAPADLDALVGTDPEGRWRLLVADTRPGDHGSLESWTLVLR